MILFVKDVPGRPKSWKRRYIDDAARRPPKAVYGANMMLAWQCGMPARRRVRRPKKHPLGCASAVL